MQGGRGALGWEGRDPIGGEGRSPGGRRGFWLQPAPSELGGPSEVLGPFSLPSGIVGLC